MVCSLWLSVYSSVEIASSIFHCHSIRRSALLSLGGRLRVRHSSHPFPVRVLSILCPFSVQAGLCPTCGRLATGGVLTRMPTCNGLVNNLRLARDWRRSWGDSSSPIPQAPHRACRSPHAVKGRDRTKEEAPIFGASSFSAFGGSTYRAGVWYS